MSTPSDKPPEGSDAPRTPPSDPFELWRQVYAANERAWNAALERTMGSPAFAEAQGKLMDSWLNAQKLLRDQTRSYLEAANVPTREDITRLGELIIGLEEKVDQMLDRLRDLEDRLRERPQG